jgi:hypothetical protein
MKGNALQRLERFREAIHEYRMALSGNRRRERDFVRYRSPAPRRAEI